MVIGNHFSASEDTKNPVILQVRKKETNLAYMGSEDSCKNVRNACITNGRKGKLMVMTKNQKLIIEENW